jgi:alkylhydroperoxidase family enzyme
MYEQIFGDRDPVTQPGTATGTPGNWWSVFANAPAVLEHAGRGFGLYVDSELPGELRELGVLRAAWLVGSQFVFSQHCKVGRGLGVSDEKMEATKAWGVTDHFSSIERALLAYTDALVLGFGHVDDALFDAVRRGLSDQQILEFTYITMTYTMHAVISKALRLEYDDRDDPIVEVPAPAEYEPDNFGVQIADGIDRAKATPEA